MTPLERVRREVLTALERDPDSVREAFGEARRACGVDDGLADLMIAGQVQAGDDLQELVLVRTLQLLERSAPFPLVVAAWMHEVWQHGNWCELRKRGLTALDAWKRVRHYTRGPEAR